MYYPARAKHSAAWCDLSPHTAHACLKRHCRLAHLPSTQSQHSPLRTRFWCPKPALPSWRLLSVFRGRGGRPDGVGGGRTWAFSLSAFKIFGRSTGTWRSMSMSTTMFVKASSSACPEKHNWNTSSSTRRSAASASCAVGARNMSEGLQAYRTINFFVHTTQAGTVANACALLSSVCWTRNAAPASSMSHSSGAGPSELDLLRRALTSNNCSSLRMRRHGSHSKNLSAACW